MNVEIVAVCLMANHYHLIVNCPVGNLSAAMQGVGVVYTRHFNATHGFDGPLHGQRYHSEPLLDDAQLMAATRYVHRNPLEVGISIGTYPWSSYLSYVRGSSSVKGLPLCTEIPLQLAGGGSKYAAFVEEDLATDKALLSDGVRDFRGYGAPTAPSLGQIDAAVATASVGTRLGDPASRATARRRQLAVLIAADRGAHSHDALARHHGFQARSSVYTAIRRARQQVEQDAATAAVVSQAKAILKTE